MSESNFRFPKGERLCGEKNVSRLFASNDTGFIYPFRYVFICEPIAEPGSGVRLLISVPKRNHKRANRRNLIKRRTREAYRLNKSGIGYAIAPAYSLSIGLVYISKEVLEYKTIETSLKRILGEIQKRSCSYATESAPND